jgi:8-amino-7-oxononanoate synthase
MKDEARVEVGVRDTLSWIDDELKSLDANDLRRHLSTRQGVQSARIILDGRELISFGSNDYLGLASDPRLAATASQAAREEGWGSGASPLVVGRSRWQERLEARLAEFEQTEAALVFSSGFAANLSVIAALVGRGDAIYGDELNHASIIDGCRLSRAEVHVYGHSEMEQLATLLESGHAYRRRLIVTDTLFSMDGDLAPLVELVELAERFDAMLLVDEAHATGVFGAHGRGVAEQLGVEDRISVRVGTLSKAFGSAGGFVAGRRNLIDWLLNRARSYVFSTAPPAAVCAASLAALDLVATEPARRESLLARAARLRKELGAAGWNIGQSASQIIPVIVGEAGRTLELAAQLRERGLFVPAIRPPSVPAGRSLLRISLSALHTDEMIAALVMALGRP